MHCAIGVLSKTLIVRNHTNRGASLMQFAEQMHDSFAVVRIEVTGRLVREQNLSQALCGHWHPCRDT